MYKLFLKVPSAHNETRYKAYRNKLSHILKKAEKLHYTDLLTANKSNLKKTWQIMKNVVNKNKVKNVNSKFRLNDGSLTENKSMISDKFNEFFVNVGPNLAKKIPETGINPLHYMGSPEKQSIFLSNITCTEIINIIANLKNGAPGYDEISAPILKFIIEDIVHLLAYLYNLSLEQGVFPKELKLANVLPLYKSDDPLMFNNYRPVSLLCVLSKVFESIMYSRLIEHLEYCKILLNNQFGFRKLHSSYMALMVLMNNLISSLEKGETVVGVFLDFSKAFDTVDHVMLLTELEHYGIRGNALAWYRSYLTDREQFVTYNGAVSSIKSVSCGVPQGSILGPLVFSLHQWPVQCLQQHTDFIC